LMVMNEFFGLNWEEEALVINNALPNFQAHCFS